MKLIKAFLLLATVVTSSGAMAHGGGHGAIEGDKAVTLAQTSAKMLTFKSYEMSVGKLDKSWNQVTKEQFILVEEGKENFIVKATNKANKQTLYFNVSKEGRVTEVSESASFEKAHGHQH